MVAGSVAISGLPTAPDFIPFSLPGGGNYGDRLATFQAFVDDDTTPLLTARVRFCDVHPENGPPTLDCAATASAGGPAKILAWDPKR